MRLLAAALRAAFLLAASYANAADRPCIAAQAVARIVPGKVEEGVEPALRCAEAETSMDRLDALPTAYGAGEVSAFTTPGKQPHALPVTLEKSCVNRQGSLLLDALRRLLGDGA
jgi:hypothetical protein